MATETTGIAASGIIYSGASVTAIRLSALFTTYNITISANEFDAEITTDDGSYLIGPNGQTFGYDDLTPDIPLNELSETYFVPSGSVDEATLIAFNADADTSGNSLYSYPAVSVVLGTGMMEGFDYPDMLDSTQIAAIKSAGYQFVVRYYSSNDSEVPLSSTELAALENAGLQVCTIFENKSEADPYTNGTADALAAIEQATEAGQPGNSGIYFAIDDSNTSTSTVEAYFTQIMAIFNNAADNPLGYKVGVYGSGASCAAAISVGATYSWLNAASYAWPNSGMFASWQMAQVAVDENPNSIPYTNLDPNGELPLDALDQHQIVVGNAIFGVDIDVAKEGVNFGAFGVGTPTLEISAASLVNSDAVPGGGGQLAYTVINSGNGPAPTTSTSELYLSTSSTLNSSAKLVSVGSVTDAALAAGGSQSDLLPFVLPSGTTPGHYYLIVVCDVGNTVPEPAGINNTYAIPITIAAAPDTSPPQLVTDKTLTLAVGGTSPITESLLRVDDNVSSHAQLTYTILNAPTNGNLLLNGKPTTSFTQTQIDDSEVTYQETASSASSDLFTFEVTDADGNTTSNQSFQIQITSKTAAATPISGTLTGTNIETGETSISSPVYIDRDNGINAALENSGTMTILSGGSIESDGNAGDTFYNFSGGILDIDAPTLIDFMPTFYNEGVLVISPGADQTVEITSYNNYSGVAFDNTGTVQVESGTFDIFQGGTSNASYINVAQGATLLFTGGSEEPFTFSGGTYNVAGTTQIGNETYAGDLVFAAGTTVNASLNWTFDNGTLDLSAATLVGSFNNLTFNGTGDYLYLGSNNATIISLDSPGTVVFDGTGVIKLTGTGIISGQNGETSFFGGGTVENLGTLNISGGGIELADGEIFENAGSLTISGGAIYDSDSNSGDTLDNLAGATLNIQFTGLDVANINNSGTINLDGGTYSPIGGYLNNTGMFNVTSGVVYLEGGGASSFSHLNASVGATLNFSTGTYNFSGGVYNGSGTTNNGASWKVVGPATIATAIGNYGTIELQSGSLTLDSTVSGSGAFLLDSDVTLALASPATFANTISGFAIGDTIDLIGVTFDANGEVTLGANNLLSVTEDNHTFDLQFDQSQSFAGDSFELLSDNNGGSEIKLAQVETVSSGQTVSGTSIAAGNSLSVFGSVISTTLATGASQVIQSGGTASGTTINSGGDQSVSSGGLDIVATVNDGGYQNVLSGGTASGTLINDPGTQVVASGGTAIGAIVSGGGQDVYGTAVSTTVNNGGLEIVESAAVAIATTVNAQGIQYDLGSALNTTLDGGEQYIDFGGYTSGGLIGAGASQQIFNGGEAAGVTIASGGKQVVSGGGFASGTIVNSGGTDSIFGSANLAVLGSGASAMIEGVVGGYGVVELASGGAFEGAIDFAGSGGALQIDDVVMPNATIGGFAQGDVIDLAGVPFVSGATATLTSGNSLAVVDGAIGATLSLSPSQDFAGEQFLLSSDGGSGTELLVGLYAVGNSVNQSSGADLDAGRTIIITVTMNGPAKVTGTPKLLLNDGGVATYAGGSGTSSLTFKYTVAAGQNIADLQVISASLPSGASVKDIHGNTADFSAIAGADLSLQIDTARPTVTSVTATPASGGTLAIGGTTMIDLDLSEAVTVTGTPVLTFNDGAKATYNASASNLTSGILVFDYTVTSGQSSSDLKITGVSVPAGASVKDLAGNTANLTLTTTEENLGLHIDGIPPKVMKVLASPTSGDVVSGATVNMTLTMSEAVTVTGNPVLALNDGANADFVSAPTSTTLVFGYVVGSESTTDLRVTGVNGGTIADSAGNAPSSSLSADLKLDVNVFTFAHTSGGGGDWNVSANWSPGGVPSNGNTALITKTGIYTVSSTEDNSVAVLETEAGATLVVGGGTVLEITDGTGTGANAGKIDVADGGTLALGGIFANNGSITLNGSTNPTELQLDGSLTLSGGGKVELSNNGDNAIIAGGSAATLTNVSNKISGAGTVGDADLSLINEAGGVIDGNGSSAALALDAMTSNAGILEGTTAQGLIISGGVVNTKTIEALGTSATVAIDSTTITDSGAAALLLASGSGAQIALDGASIVGGKLQTTGKNAAIAIEGGSTDVLSGVTITTASFIEVNDGATLTLAGTISNAGIISANAISTTTTLEISGAVTFEGGGKVYLSNDSDNDIAAGGTAATLSNVNNTIAGAGTLGGTGLTLINSAGGVIDGNGSSAALVLNAVTSNFGLLEGTTSQGLVISGAVTDAKTIEALGTSAVVEIVSTIITNTSTGIILASGSGAQIALDGATIVSGKLQTTGKNAAIAIESGSTDVLSSAVVEANTLIEVASGAMLILSGGSIAVGAIVETLNGGTVVVTGTVANSGTLYANGSGSLVQITSGAVVSGGVAKVGNGVVDILGASNENVAFLSTGTGGLQLDGTGSAYSGKVSGFGPVDGGSADQFIDFTAIDFAGATVSYTPANPSNTSGTLTVSGGGVSASVTLVGHYTSASFTSANDGNGHLEIFDPVTYYTSALTIASGKSIIASGGDIIAESTVTNGGTFEAENGNDIEVVGALTDSATGLTEATSGSDLSLENTVNNSGRLEALDANVNFEGVLDNGGTVEATTEAAMNVQSSLNNSGTVEATGSVINVDGNITNSGTITGASGAALYLDAPAGLSTPVPTDIQTNTLITNDGTIDAESNTTIIITPGNGDANTGLINNGAITANGIDPSILLEPGGSFTNAGKIEATAGQIQVLSYVNNLGTIEAAGTSQVYLDGSLSMNGPLGSGLYSVTNSGVLQVTGTGAMFVGESSGGSAQIDGTGYINDYSTSNSSVIDKLTIAGLSNVNVNFGSGVGLLILNAINGNAYAYSGAISGFTDGDGIDLPNVQYVGPANETVTYTPLSTYLGPTLDSAGVLSVYSGSLVAQIYLTGVDPATGEPYTSSSFTLASDGYGTMILDPTVTMQQPGNAPASVGNGEILEINTPDSSNVTFTGASSKLVLDQPETFTGKVVNFGAQNALDLSQITFGSNPVTLGYSENNSGTGGTLSVSDGIHTASIALLGNYMAASFVTAADGHGGTLVTEATHPSPTLAHPHA